MMVIFFKGLGPVENISNVLCTVLGRVLIYNLSAFTYSIDHGLLDTLKYFRPSVILFEITVTWDCRLDAARQEKSVKYAELMAKISRTCPVQVKKIQTSQSLAKISTSFYSIQSCNARADVM